MILSLFIVSGIMFLIGLFLFWKRKPVLAWVFILAAIAGFLLGLTVIYYFPSKM